MLSSQQEQVIADTAPVVAEHLETIVQRFYPLMFERYPEVRALFNAAHQKDGTQPRALARSILAYVGMREDRNQARQALATAIGKHVSLGIQPEHYPIVGECLMAAIGEVLGDAVTPEVADAWSALYQELADLLIEAEEEQYAAFASQPGGWRGIRTFRVARRTPESRVITSFELEPVDGEPVAAHRPGQYIGVRLEIDGEPVYRHYSVSCEPNGRTLRISVKREEEGRASRFLHDQAEEGFALGVLPPAGDLVLRGDEPLVLVSGGVGQTPLLPMAREAVRKGRPVTWIHAARDEDHHAFDDEIRSLASEHPQLFRPVVVYEEDHSGRADHTGLVTPDLLREHIPGEDARCYFVGPQGFMEKVDAALDALGIDSGRRHYEHFGPSQPLHA